MEPKVLIYTEYIYYFFFSIKQCCLKEEQNSAAQTESRQGFQLLQLNGVKIDTDFSRSTTSTSISKQTKRCIDRCSEQPASTCSLLCPRILRKNIPENKHTFFRVNLPFYNLNSNFSNWYFLTLNIAFFSKYVIS